MDADHGLSSQSQATIQQTDMDQKSVLVSIVIPTFNRAALLRDSIPLLMNQETSGEVSYEVIFVDNGSPDETASVLADAAKLYSDKLSYFSIEPRGGPAAPRPASFGRSASQRDALSLRG